MKLIKDLATAGIILSNMLKYITHNTVNMAKRKSTKPNLTSAYKVIWQRFAVCASGVKKPDATRNSSGF